MTDDLSIPTVSQVTGWQLGLLGDQGTYWTQRASKLKTELDGLNTNVGNSIDYIVGKFGNALREKVLADRTDGYKVAEVLENAASAVQGEASGDMQFAQSMVINNKTTIAAEGYLVGEDGTVVLSLSQIANALSDKKDGTVKFAALQRQADEYSKSLKVWLHAAAVAAKRVTDEINKAFSDLPGSSNGIPSVPVTGAEGTDLGKKVKDSDTVPPDVVAQIDQVLDKTGLSPEDLATLQNGGTITVPASTLEFTQKFLDAAGPDGFSKLSAQLQARGPDGATHARELADAVVLLSNEKVKGIKADGSQIEGGYSQLPAATQQLISTRVSVSGSAPDGNSTEYPDLGKTPQIANQGAFLQSQNKFLDALGLADKDYAPGTKMSTELYRQGMHLAWLESHNSQLGSNPDIRLDDSLTQSISLAARNHEGTTAILTGQGSPDILGSGYHPDTAMMSLLERSSSDPSHSPIAAMTDWITQDAKVTLSPTDPGYQHQLDESTLAGRSARGLADIITTTKSADGTNNFNVLFTGSNPSDITPHNAGMAPEVSQHIAKALAPYVGNMVDTPENLVGTHGFGTYNPVESTRLFTLMDNDPKAAAILNGAAIAQANEFNKEFALGTGGQDLALYSGRLNGLVEGGVAANSGIHGYDSDTAAARNKEILGASYMSAKEFFNAGLKDGVFKLVPGEKLVMPVVNSIEAFIKDPYVNSYSYKPEIAYPQLYAEMPDGKILDYSQAAVHERMLASQHYTMLQALVDGHRIESSSLPADLLDNDGHLLPFSQVKDPVAVKIPDILTAHGITPDQRSQYETNSSTGNKTVSDIVFGGSLVAPNSPLYVSVLRGSAAPTNSDRWP